MRPERGRRHDISAVTQERPDGQAWDFLVNAQNGIEVPCTAVVQRNSDGVGGIGMDLAFRELHHVLNKRAGCGCVQHRDTRQLKT